MKKFLLSSFAFLSLAYGAHAQCKTCSQGKHDPNDTTVSHKLTPNGNASLGQSYIQQNVCGLNYVTATTATATRYSPPYSGFPATLVVAGLPVCYTIQKAFLYYGASYTEATPPATTATVTNPIPSTATYAATNVGQDGSVCWGEVGTVTYRSDVTAAISGNGTYKVSLNGFANAAWEVDGLTLIIIYTTPAAYSGSISLWDGCITFVGGTTVNTYSGFTACAAATNCSAFLCGGDMQSNVNGNANSQTINGSGVNTFTNNFWNTNVQAVPNLTAGQTTCVYSPYIGNAGDCWFWSVAGLYWQNTSCVVCTAGTMTVTPTQVNPTCGNNNGSITVGVTGGTAPYTYTWTPAVSTTSSATGLSAGTYSITVKDAGCNVTTVVVTLVTTSVTVTATTTANVKCNGGATGSASCTAAGGTAPYTYAWTPTGGTNSTATGLTAGTYTITVKDKNGCTATATTTITQPPALTASTTVVPVKCNGGATGSSTVTAGGGTPAYLYSWAPGGNTNANATGLTAGTYTVTVTDANGCTITATSVITQPPVLTATTTTTPVKCNGGATGSATVTAGGGTPAYTYAWAPGGNTNANATGLTAGTYTITVKDANGCSITATATVTQPPVLTATTTNTPVKCNGGATGSATVTAGGGTPAYLYSWAPGGNTNANATGLTAGTYTVTVTDANGCTITATSTITQPPVLTATTTNTPVKCNGGATGSATVTAGGGTPAYLYSWAPGGNTNTNATGLTAGTYTVTVTDANGCTITATATITQPPVLTATTTTTTATCGGSNGSATVTAGGGTPAYTYTWAPVVGTNATLTGLSAGTYTITVKDANGCSITATAIVANAAAETVTISGSTNILCNGGANGSITTNTVGGTPPYTYAWTPSGGTGANATGLTAGCYTVTVKDANGCVATASACLTQPTALTATTTNTPVKCNGGATGSATVTAGGGTPAYVYTWAPGGNTNANATGLTAGTYTVTVKDANGCTITATATITQPLVLTATTTNAPVLCNGGATGSATVTAGGGTPAYTYAWAPGGNTNANATGLTAGTYTVTVKDANGCSITATATITQPPALTTTTTTTTATCGGSNGSATVTAGGGTPAYIYTWAPVVGTNATLTGLSAGSYTVTVKDANGCSITASVIVANAAAETVTVTGSTNILCNGGANGSITTNTVGGTAPYTYAWTPAGGTGANATGLTAGCYTVTVKDANGCVATASACLTQPTALTATTTNTPVLCNGGATGSAMVTAGGGTPAYIYAWAPGGNTNANATGLTAGTYTVTVKDANGCTITATATITQPPALTATTTNTPVLCNGGTTGSATVTAGGGTPAYTYAWAPGGNTNANATGLTAGTYTVTVKDANGCSITATATITQPPALTASTTTTTATCGGSNGSATVTAGGGTPAYTYSWAPVVGTNANLTGLSAGAYTITVTDKNGCTITATAIVANAAAETVSITGSVNILCNGGNNGSITTNTVGGTAPYTYAWTPAGGTGANATGLTAGCYTVTVKDANGCVSTASACLTQPTALTATTTTTPVKCNGGNTGSATVTAGGGTPGYLYTWAPGGQTNITATNLTAGTYTVTVKDANGCTITATATITQPPVLTATTTNIPVKCNGGNTGSATVTAGGGTPAYTYAWAPGGQTNANATNLTAGIYTVTVTDANGCSITATATITQPPALTATTTNTTATCGQSNGSVTVTAGGGTAAYIYSWTPSGATTANVTGLSANTYTVTVTDANGCTITVTATVGNAAAETVSISGSTNILCNGGNNGGVTTTTAGGTPPYTYTWTPGGQTGANATGLTAGCYTVTVKDANGCVSTASACLTQPTALTATTTNTPVLCNGGNTGSATVTAGGGTPAYTYAWAPGGQTNANATNLTAGTYTITVKDANGCSITATATVTQPPALTATTITIPVKCNAGNTGGATVTAGGGTPAYTYAWAPGGQTNANATGLTAGTYTVTVTDANGCSITATATITQPPALTATTTTVQSTCGNPNGGASVTAGGGIPAYTYAWSSGQTTTNASGLSAGSYTVTVTDANGCTLTAVANVTNASGETATMNPPVNVLCNGGNNGSATVTVVGGVTPYTYSWNPTGQTNATATGLTAGSYTVTVKDANGCVSTASVTITQPPVVTVATSGIINVLCNGGNNGGASATGGGGTPAYTYAWSNGQTGSNATGLTAGTYTVTETDADGCITTATATITQPPVLTATVGVATNVSCNGGSNGSVTVTAGGGTPAYTYAWTNAQTNANATGLTVGSYTVTITDADGCSVTASVTITQPTPITLAKSSTSSFCSQPDGSATITAAGGTPGYVYLWSNGATTSSINNVIPGSYCVTVTDTHGCQDTACITVPNTTGEIVSINPPVNVLCNGGNNGSATATVTGGVAPYTYNWNPTGQTNANATGLTAGTYTVTVKDSAGCSATASVTITQPPVLTTSATVTTNVSCNGLNDGSATTTSAGGTTPYTYLWSNGQTTTNATGLTAGSYTATVTDADGCTATASITITQPPVLTATMGVPTNVLCNGGNNGSATVTAGGGTLAYTYAWTNAQTNANATGLTAGSYTVTVTDNHGCTATASVTITEPPLLTLTKSSTTAFCSQADGSATITAAGGTPGYVYLWSNGATTSSITNVIPASYCVTVTDTHGCQDTACITVPNTVGETVSINPPVNVLCNGGNNGSATVVVTGGVAPYTYNWNPTAQTNANATGLTAGTYTVTVKDSAGCSATASVTITQPPVLTTSDSVITNVSCNGFNDGSAYTTPIGGTTPYTYLWSNGQTTTNATGLTAGSYTATVTDAHGCTATASIIITQPPLLTATMGVPTNVLCNGGNNGSATVTAGGGTIAYTYAWTNAQTNANATGLTAGSYTVTITDNHGCTVTASVTITEPPVLTLAKSETTAFCSKPDGTATITAAGGTPAYTYLWSNGATTSSIKNITPGSYCVTVTDSHGCQDTACITVLNKPGETVSITAVTNVSCNAGNNGSLTATPNAGTPAYTYAWTNGQTNAIATGLTAGSYTVTVTDSAGCTATATAIVTQPTVLVTTAGAPVTICIGSTASINVTATGGTPAYTYNWSNGATGSTISVSPIVTTTYTETTTDANGCISPSVTVTVTVNPPLSVVTGNTVATCPGGSVTITATAKGGDGVYTYTWMPGNEVGQTVTVTPVATGYYTVTVNDDCGTPVAIDSVLVTVDPLPTVSFSADSLSGCSPLCVTFTDLTKIASGGLKSWAWNFGDSNTSAAQDPHHCYPDAGKYTVSLTVTSDSGCNSILTVPNMITVYSHPVAAFDFGPQPAMITNPVINFTDKSTDAYGIASWFWTFGDPGDVPSTKQNPTYTYPDTGTYCATLVVTNIHGCTDSITHCLIISPEYTLYIPNAFSPNGDGLNEVFQPKGNFVKDYKMYIFDRWGMMIFYTDDFYKGWNGTVNGGSRICQEDTYVYMIEATDNLGTQHKYIGRVTLLK